MNSETLTPKEVYRAVGSKIREERLRLNLTQDDLARSVGLTRASVTNIERGCQRMPVHTLVALAASLRISPAQLLSSLEPRTSVTIEAMVPGDVSETVRQWIRDGAAKAPLARGHR
ncbi:MAG: helix-turn-helix transcriptional regulator [Verrucomicrobiota bacterium]